MIHADGTQHTSAKCLAEQRSQAQRRMIAALQLLREDCPQWSNCGGQPVFSFISSRNRYEKNRPPSHTKYFMNLFSNHTINPFDHLENSRKPLGSGMEWGVGMGRSLQDWKRIRTCDFHDHKTSRACKPWCPREAHLPHPIRRELLAAATMAMTAMTSVTMTTMTQMVTTGGGREEGGRAQGNNEASVRSAQPMVAATTVAMEAWKRWQKRRQERKRSFNICVKSRSLQLPSRNQVSRMLPSSTTSISNDE